jgi:hypothetical protein
MFGSQGQPQCPKVAGVHQQFDHSRSMPHTALAHQWTDPRPHSHRRLQLEQRRTTVGLADVKSRSNQEGQGKQVQVAAGPGSAHPSTVSIRSSCPCLGPETPVTTIETESTRPLTLQAPHASKLRPSSLNLWSSNVRHRQKLYMLGGPSCLLQFDPSSVLYSKYILS